jgi:DEAD/DEAH box helicase domain-containing protein
MADPLTPETSAIAKRSEGSSLGRPDRQGRKDGALEAALDRLAPDRTLERPDTPDLHVTAVRRLPAVAARFAPFPGALDRRLIAGLKARGISELYSHQAAANDHALAGRHVVVITPTASGKTLCYNAPVLHSILQDPSSRALYLFPTKALAQDQLAELQGMAETIASSSGEQVGVYTYDGDTPQDARRAIRSRAHIVLSNPDMVH